MYFKIKPNIQREKMQDLILSIRNSLDGEKPPAQTLKEAFDQDTSTSMNLKVKFNHISMYSSGTFWCYIPINHE